MRRYVLRSKPSPQKRLFANLLSIVVLSQVRADQRDQLQLDLHLPRSQGATEGGPGYSVRQLWLQRVRVKRLSIANAIFTSFDC